MKGQVSKGMGLLLGIIVIASGVYLSRRPPDAVAQVPAVQPVAVVKVARGNLCRIVHLTAELAPYQDIDVYAKVAGYLDSIKVDIGDNVKAGQVIAKLDLPEQRADHEKAKVDYEMAKLDYDRLESVAKRKPGLIAQQDLDEKFAVVNVAKAKLAYAQTILDYAVITAPFDGFITKRWANPGALIQTGISSSTAVPVVRLAEIKKLRLVFQVPESSVEQIRVGVPVEITIGTTQQVIQGKIARYARKLDDATRTMSAEVDLDNSDLSLTPGIYANVDLRLDARENVLVLPPQAVSGKENSTVLRVNANNKTEECPVKLGLQAKDKVEIVSGLVEGDSVVFGSRSALSPGATVNPQPAGVIQ